MVPNTAPVLPFATLADPQGNGKRHIFGPGCRKTNERCALRPCLRRRVDRRVGPLSRLVTYSGTSLSTPDSRTASRCTSVKSGFRWLVQKLKDSGSESRCPNSSRRLLAGGSVNQGFQSLDEIQPRFAAVQFVLLKRAQRFWQPHVIGGAPESAFGAPCPSNLVDLPRGRSRLGHQQGLG